MSPACRKRTTVRFLLLVFWITNRLPNALNCGDCRLRKTRLRLQITDISDAPTMPQRTVFFISDGTGITAETFGNAILAQFEMKARHVRLPFVDTADKAYQAVRQINHTGVVDGNKPIVFTTLVNMEVLKVIQEGCQGM
eukprot:gene27403-48983_t